MLAGLVRKQVLMIRADPLSPERGQYAFAQGLLRTVAYEMLSRRSESRVIARPPSICASAFPNEGEDVAEVIASHYLDAYRASRDTDPDTDQLRQSTVEALKRAARRAVTIGAQDVARRAYEQAAEIADDPDRPELLQAAGEAAYRAGRLEDAVALFDTAAELYGAAGRERERALIAYAASGALRGVGRLQESIERLTAAIDNLAAPDAVDPDVGRVGVRLGLALATAGEYDRAAPVLTRALTIAQALELPDVLCEALAAQATLYESIGRHHEARYLYAAAVDLAEQHDLGSVGAAARANLANLLMTWNLPGAREHFEAVLATQERRGTRYNESVTSFNLMTIHFYAGRWEELERIARELFDADPDRPGGAFIHARLVLLHAVRGDPGGAEAALEQLGDSAASDDPEAVGIYDLSVMVTQLAYGRTAEALDTGLQMLPTAVRSVGPSSDAARDGWPDALTAALHTGRHADAHTIIDLLAAPPPGLIPPYLRAQLARGRALLAAAEDRHEAVEIDLRTAIETLTKLAYPYWRAVTQTDLAAWLIDQERGTEAEPLLAEAIPTLSALRAAPALARAESFGRALAHPVASKG